MNTNTVMNFTRLRAAVQQRTPRREWPPPAIADSASELGEGQP